MKTFVASRLGAMAAILIALTGVMFLLQHISPLDPVKAQLGAQASASAVAARREALGLNEPDAGAVLALPDRRRHRRPRHVVPHPPRGGVRSRRLLPGHTGTRDLRAGDRAACWPSLLAFSTTLKWRGAGVLRAVLFTGSSAPMFLLGILGLIVFYKKLGWVPANGRIGITEPADRARRDC